LVSKTKCSIQLSVSTTEHRRNVLIWKSPYEPFFTACQPPASHQTIGQLYDNLKVKSIAFPDEETPSRGLRPRWNALAPPPRPPQAWKELVGIKFTVPSILSVLSLKRPHYQRHLRTDNLQPLMKPQQQSTSSPEKMGMLFQSDVPKSVKKGISTRSTFNATVGGYFSHR